MVVAVVAVVVVVDEKWNREPSENEPIIAKAARPLRKNRPLPLPPPNDGIGRDGEGPLAEVVAGDGKEMFKEPMPTGPRTATTERAANDDDDVADDEDEAVAIATEVARIVGNGGGGGGGRGVWLLLSKGVDSLITVISGTGSDSELDSIASDLQIGHVRFLEVSHYQE